MKKLQAFFNKIYFVVFLFCVCTQNGQTQSSEANPMVQEDSKLTAWSFGFTSTGGELYGSKKRNVLSTNIRYLKFMVEKFALGASIAVSREVVDDESASAWSVGAEAAYFFNNGGNTSPYIGFGLNYLNFFTNDRNQGGLRGTPKVGLALSRRQVVLMIEAGSHVDWVKKNTGYTIYTSVGIAYSFYWSKKQD